MDTRRGLLAVMLWEEWAVSLWSSGSKASPEWRVLIRLELIRLHQFGPVYSVYRQVPVQERGSLILSHSVLDRKSVG